MKFPSVILIDNSSFCNLKCSICDHKNISKYRKKQHMAISLYKKLIDEIAVKNPNARVWEIFFGDPFCCPDMSDRIAYAKHKGLTDVVLNTNGLAMAKKKSKLLIEAGLDAMYVGIDALHKETYDKIRVGGNLDRVIHNTIDYRNLLDAIGKPEQKLFVQFVECDQNKEEMKDFRDFWVDQKINVKIRPKVSWGGRIQADNLKKNVVRKPCKWLMESLSVCADGRVALCAVDLHCSIPCGNCVDQTIEEVWNDKLKTYRRFQKAASYELLPDFCKNCLDWQSAYCAYESVERED